MLNFSFLNYVISTLNSSEQLRNFKIFFFKFYLKYKIAKLNSMRSFVISSLIGQTVNCVRLLFHPFHVLAAFRSKIMLKIALFLLMIAILWLSQLIIYYKDLGSRSNAETCRCETESSLNFQSYRKTQYQSNNETKSQLLVLIISEARSGSSFLGDLLQQISSTYYSFEPLVNVHSSLFATIIFEILKCRFKNLTDSYLKPIYWNKHYLEWNALLAKTVNQQDPIQLFNHTIHERLCHSAKTILVKTIRLTLTDFWKARNLYGNKEHDLHLLYLVRDPRAVMNSRYRMSWCQRTENCTDVEVLCDRMSANIKILRQIKASSRNHVTLIRYEDLVSGMMDIVPQLLAFLGTSSLMDEHFFEWIRLHTSADDALANPVSSYRNIKTQVEQWRTDLIPEELEEIENDCVDVMRQLGYKPLFDCMYNRSNMNDDDDDEDEDDECKHSESIFPDYPLSEMSIRHNHPSSSQD